ncbi:MAG: MFS transporter [Chloroflexi bacterium]|nr:MFS transporter [Chloroflexota bacterium]
MAGRTLALPSSIVGSRGLFQAGNLLYWLALYFYVPILPVYAKGMGASLTLVGIVLSAYGVMQLLLRIPTGVASDVAGRRKPFVLAGLALTVAGAVGFLWAPSPEYLVIARAITGLAACAWVAITVMYSGYYPPSAAASAIGLMGLTNGLGQVMATWTGGLAADAYGWQAPFVLSTVAGTAGLALMALCHEPRSEMRATPVTWRRIWSVGTSRTLLFVSILSAINTYATFTTVFGFVPVYAKELGASAAQLGLLTAMSVVPSTLAQPLTARLARWIGFRATIFGGLALTGAMTAIIPLTQSIPALAASQIAGGAGRGLLGASFMSLAILGVAQRERATAMGVYQAVYAIGMFLGPLVGGVVGERFGLGAVFVSTGLLSLGAGIAAWWGLRAGAGPTESGGAAAPTSGRASRAAPSFARRPA